jgi:hypothetical protein
MAAGQIDAPPFNCWGGITEPSRLFDRTKGLQLFLGDRVTWAGRDIGDYP